MKTQFSKPPLTFIGARIVASIFPAIGTPFTCVWTGTPGLQGGIEQVKGPLTGARFYMARVVTSDGKALTLFDHSRVGIESKVAAATPRPGRYRTRVGEVVVDGKTWGILRGKLK